MLGGARPALAPPARPAPPAQDPLPHSQVATLVPVLVSQSDIRAAQGRTGSEKKTVKMFPALEVPLRLSEESELGVVDVRLPCPVECPALSSPV